MLEIILLLLTFAVIIVWMIKGWDRSTRRTSDTWAQSWVDTEARYPQMGEDDIYHYGRDNLPGGLYNQRLIMAAGGLAEQRRCGRLTQGGRVVVPAIDPDDPRLDFDVKTVQRHLESEGPPSRVYLRDRR